MPYNATGVVSSGFPIDVTTFTYYLTGTAATDAAAADAIGKAVSQDTAAASSVKLAADGEQIFGRIYHAENRSDLGVRTAAVQRKFKEKLPAAEGHGITLGANVVGAGNGLVKAGAVPAGGGPRNYVVEVGTNFVVVEQL